MKLVSSLNLKIHIIQNSKRTDFKKEKQADTVEVKTKITKKKKDEEMSMTLRQPKILKSLLKRNKSEY